MSAVISHILLAVRAPLGKSRKHCSQFKAAHTHGEDGGLRGMVLSVRVRPQLARVSGNSWYLQNNSTA